MSPREQDAGVRPVDRDAAELGPAVVTRLDVDDMLGAVAALPRQLAAGYPAALSVLARAFGAAAGGPPTRPAGLVLCGMGGSAIGADLVLACVPGLGVPATVVRGYELPAWAGPETLVIAASYSGQTEETLACAAAALERGCRPVCVASGGALAAVAEDHGLPLVRVPGGGQPRAAVGYLATAMLAALAAAGIADAGDAVGEAAALLREGNDRLGPGRPATENAAKALALRLFKHQAVIYGAGLTAPAARRWKGQINENAKAPAFWNELPELDHNEIMGWSSLPHVAASCVAVFLEDPAGDPRLLRRAELTATELRTRGVTVEHVRAAGDSRLARLFGLVQLGDFVSCYLALLYGVDPTPVQAIQDFKSRLAGPG